MKLIVQEFVVHPGVRALYNQLKQASILSSPAMRFHVKTSSIIMRIFVQISLEPSDLLPRLVKEDQLGKKKKSLSQKLARIAM